MSKERIEAVVFDLGGVLIDWNPRYLYRKLFNEESEMEEFLTEVCNFEWNNGLDRGGQTFAAAVQSLSARYPHYSREIEAYHLRWEEMLGGEIRGTVRLLQRLDDREVPLHSLTNFSAEKFVIARERFPFLGLFRQIVVSGEEGMVKPEPEIYERLVQRSGLDPTRTAFVDDSQPNVRAASEHGFTALHFRNPEDLERDLSRLQLV